MGIHNPYEHVGVRTLTLGTVLQPRGHVFAGLCVKDDPHGRTKKYLNSFVGK